MDISIVIPAYNNEKTINKAINSALNQDFPKNNFEIIVVNDGSIDNTLTVLKKYGKKIKLINQKNKGPVKAANVGFRKAQGKYVIKLDADDYFKPNILKEMVKVFDSNSKIDFVYCDYLEKLENGKVKKISTKNIFNTLSGGVMFKKNKFVKEGFYREDIKFPEYDLLLRIEKKWQGYRIAEPLFYYNRTKGSLTSSKEWLEEALRELKEIHFDKVKKIKKIRKY